MSIEKQSSHNDGDDFDFTINNFFAAVARKYSCIFKSRINMKGKNAGNQSLYVMISSISQRYMIIN